jgi:hypothetical protein
MHRGGQAAQAGASLQRAAHPPAAMNLNPALSTPWFPISAISSSAIAVSEASRGISGWLSGKAFSSASMMSLDSHTIWPLMLAAGTSLFGTTSAYQSGFSCRLIMIESYWMPFSSSASHT